MLWIHHLVGGSHFAECCKNPPVTVWEMVINLLESLFRNGEGSGKVMWNPCPWPDHHQIARPSHDTEFQLNRLINFAVSLLYRALILLGLAICLPRALCLQSSCCYIDSCNFFATSFSLPFSELSLVGLAHLVDEPSSFSADTVGWVIKPVKLSPKWPIMCRVER